MESFLPDTNDLTETLYYTAAYLTLATGTYRNPVVGGHPVRKAYPLFAPTDGMAIESR